MSWCLGGKKGDIYNCSGKLRTFKLKIAGYNIGFEASANGPDLAVSPKFLRNLSYDTNYDINIRIHSGSYNLPEEAERVFHAPYVEEKHHTGDYSQPYSANHDGNPRDVMCHSAHPG